MHPSRKILKLFAENRLDNQSVESVKDHLQECEFCREFCQNYQLVVDSIEATRCEEIPPVALELANRLYNQTIGGIIVPLLPLTSTDSKSGLNLAADGDEKHAAHVQNLTTLYSENPELVMRIMRDPNRGHDYLQLISDDAGLVANVLVQLPELDREYITDKDGHATLDDEPPTDWNKLKWQIKMPDAVFDLEPLVYDPDKVEYSKETILETDRQDRIEVVFEGKTKGKQITLRILELDGTKEFGNIRVVVSQADCNKLLEARPGEAITFDLADLDSAINIRLFQ